MNELNTRAALPHRWCLFVVLLAAPAAAQNERLDSYVNDYAGIVDNATRQQLETALSELEQKTTAQFVILTIPSTNGRDIYDYGRDVFNNAGATGKGLGQKGKDNGVLLLIAHKDRKYHIFVGQGIEDTLPDLYTDQLAQEFLIPQFRKSNYSAGVRDTGLAIANKLAEEAGVTLNHSPMPQRPRTGSRRNFNAGPGVVFFVVVVMIILQAMARKRRYRRARWGSDGFWSALFWNAVLNAGTRSGRSGGGSSWGGGGGFGGGGFGGGGGGSFGGGGSGGSW